MIIDGEVFDLSPIARMSTVRFDAAAGLIGVLNGDAPAGGLPPSGLIKIGDNIGCCIAPETMLPPGVCTGEGEDGCAPACTINMLLGHDCACFLFELTLLNIASACFLSALDIGLNDPGPVGAIGGRPSSRRCFFSHSNESTGDARAFGLERGFGLEIGEEDERR